MTFVVRQSDEPLPPIAKPNAIYPFATMEVGDIFDAPRTMGRYTSRADARQASIIASAHAWAKRNNPTARFATRIIDEATVRCRRIA